MEAVGLHPDTPLTPVGMADDGRPCRSVALIASRVDALLDQAEHEIASVALLIRDGGDDARPGPASLDLMSSAGRLSHLGDVLSSLGLLQVAATGGYCEDAERNAATWAQCHAGLSNADVGKGKRVARSMTRYPLIAAAYVNGDLRTSHLTAIDDI